MCCADKIASSSHNYDLGAGVPRTPLLFSRRLLSDRGKISIDSFDLWHGGILKLVEVVKVSRRSAYWTTAYRLRPQQNSPLLFTVDRIMILMLHVFSGAEQNYYRDSSADKKDVGTRRGKGVAKGNLNRRAAATSSSSSSSCCRAADAAGGGWLSGLKTNRCC